MRLGFREKNFWIIEVNTLLYEKGEKIFRDYYSAEGWEDLQSLSDVADCGRGGAGDLVVV